MKKAYILVLVAVLMVSFVQEAKAAEVVNTTFNDYIWNWVLWYTSAFKMISCNYIGLWGILRFNDNGIMAEKCFSFGLKGGRAAFSGYKPIKKKEGRYKAPPKKGSNSTTTTTTTETTTA